MQKTFNKNSCNDGLHSFWQDYLQNIPEQIQLPYSFPRPGKLTGNTVIKTFSLPDRLIDQINIFCEQLKVPVNIFFLAGLKVFLWKYSGQYTVVVGVADENNENSYSAKYTPVRTDVDGEIVVSDWFKQVGLALSECRQHFIELNTLVKTMSIQPAENSHPLFQVSCCHINESCDDLFNPINGNADGFSSCDLSFCSYGKRQFQCAFLFSSDLFASPEIKSFKDHFVKILEWLVVNSKVKLSELSLLTEIDLECIQHLNKTDRPEFLGKTWLELFEQIVSTYPEKEAVRFKSRSLTYLELAQRSSAVAALLLEQSVSKNDFVGVLVARGLESLLCLIGIMKCGAVYVPLDSGVPVDRLQYIIKDSGLKYLITDPAIIENGLLEGSECTIVSVDGFRLADCSRELISVSVKPADLAYMIYTSGSTGRPKGVPVCHGALANFLLTTAETPGIDKDDVVVALGSTAFDISLPEMLLPIVNGARLVIGASEVVQDGGLLADLLDIEDVTYMLATPVTWTILFESGWQGKSDLKMLSAGDALSHNLIVKMLAAGAEVWNGYGTTETTIMSSYFRIDNDTVEPLIGRPMANTGYYILDEYGNVLPPGIVGELAISGIALSSGYNKQESLTQKAFVDLTVPESGTSRRVYKTGDLARLTGSGDYRCLGRVDSQVKIRGYRIELGEIETRLVQHHKVVDCCCSVLTYSEMDKRIIVYYKAVEPVELKELRAFLAKKLPSYMMPVFYMYMEDFPKNQNQKIDKKMLPVPGNNEFSNSEIIDVGLLSKLEQDVLSVWQDILKYKNIGIDDDFFAIGGTSLNAIRLITKINKKFAIDVPLIICFQYSTIRFFSRYLDGMLNGNTDLMASFHNLIEINAVGDKVPFILVHGDAANDFLPKVLGADQPFYGFIHQGADGNRMRYEKVEDIARHYLQELQKVRPHGPYILSGFSFGGLIAVQMAYLLEKQEEKVHGVVLIDTSHPSVIYDEMRHMSFFKRMKRMIRFSMEMLGNIRISVASNYYFFIGRTIPANLRSRYILRIYRQAGTVYSPPVVSCPVVLLRAEKSRISDPVNGWQGITTGKFSVDKVSGDHLSMIRDPVNYKLLQGKLVETIAEWQ